MASYPTSPLTSNTAPSPYVASASGIYSPTYDAWKAFDSDPTGTFWNNLGGFPCWLELDLGSAIALTSIDIHGYVTPSYSPQNFTIQGSTNGSSWTTLYTGTAVSWTANQIQNFALSGTYRYVRINVTSTIQGTYTAIPNVVIYGASAPSQTTLAAIADHVATATATMPGSNNLNAVAGLSFTAKVKAQIALAAVADQASTGALITLVTGTLNLAAIAGIENAAQGIMHGSVDLGAITGISLQGKSVNFGSGVAVLPGFKSSGSGQLIIIGSGASLLPPFQSKGNIILIPTGSGASLLPPFRTKGGGFRNPVGSGIALLPPFTSQGSGFNSGFGSGIVILPPIKSYGYGTVIPAALTYMAAVINVKTEAVSEYPLYAFNSFCIFQGKVLGANNNGIFLLEGPDDSGTKIAAAIKSGQFDAYGSQNMSVERHLPPMANYKKQPGEAWVLHDGDMTIIITGDKNGSFEYPVLNDRAIFGQGFFSRLYDIEMKNVANGSPFWLKMARILAQQIQHRVR